MGIPTPCGYEPHGAGTIPAGGENLMVVTIRRDCAPRYVTIIVTREGSVSSSSGHKDLTETDPLGRVRAVPYGRSVFTSCRYNIDFIVDKTCHHRLGKSNSLFLTILL